MGGANAVRQDNIKFDFLSLSVLLPECVAFTLQFSILAVAPLAELHWRSRDSFLLKKPGSVAVAGFSL